MPILVPSRRFAFETVDYLFPSKTTLAADALGQAQVLFDPVDSPYYWLVERIVVIAPGAPLAASALVWVGEPIDGNIRDYSPSAGIDVADEAQPIVVPSGGYLRVKWFGLTPGLVGTCSLQVRFVERVAL